MFDKEPDKKDVADRPMFHFCGTLGRWYSTPDGTPFLYCSVCHGNYDEIRELPWKYAEEFLRAAEKRAMDLHTVEKLYGNAFVVGMRKFHAEQHSKIVRLLSKLKRDGIV